MPSRNATARCELSASGAARKRRPTRGGSAWADVAPGCSTARPITSVAALAHLRRVQVAMNAGQAYAVRLPGGKGGGRTLPRRQLPDGPHLDRVATDSHERVIDRDRDRLVEARDLDDGVAAQLLLGLRERPVRRDRLAV